MKTIVKINSSLSVDLPTEQASISFAKNFAKLLLSPPLVITFSGEIGMGKTTIIRCILQTLGVSSAIKSPTFSLVESYDLGLIQFHHFDLYRIGFESELDYIGFRDYFGCADICCIEWPERLHSSSLDIDLAFSLMRQGDGRCMNIMAKSAKGRGILELFNNSLLKDK